MLFLSLSIHALLVKDFILIDERFGNFEFFHSWPANIGTVLLVLGHGRLERWWFQIEIVLLNLDLDIFWFVEVHHWVVNYLAHNFLYIGLLGDWGGGALSGNWRSRFSWGYNGWCWWCCLFDNGNWCCWWSGGCSWLSWFDW